MSLIRIGKLLIDPEAVLFVVWDKLELVVGIGSHVIRFTDEANDVWEALKPDEKAPDWRGA